MGMKGVGQRQDEELVESDQKKGFLPLIHDLFS